MQDYLRIYPGLESVSITYGLKWVDIIYELRLVGNSRFQAQISTNFV